MHGEIREQLQKMAIQQWRTTFCFWPFGRWKKGGACEFFCCLPERIFSVPFGQQANCVPINGIFGQSTVEI
jgi:hypothetical protein